MIPDEITTVKAFSFIRCASIVTLTIPSHVTSIGAAAFTACANLTSATISSNVTQICAEAFYQCNNLTSVTFKNTEGWWVGKNETSISGFAISFEELSDTTTAAEYLKSTYSAKYWFCG